MALLVAVGLSLALAPAPVVGLCDDRFGLPPLARLGVQFVVATGFVSCAGGIDRLPLPPPLDMPLDPLGTTVSVLWIVAVVNFYNFMDGIDGLAGLQALITGAGIAVAGFDPFASYLGTALAGAAAGFLVFNWSPASIFLGDAGSGVLGFTLAALPFLAPRESRAGILSLVALSLWFFLADATFTLLKRIARGARLHEAHREHLYQRLVISGLSHSRVSAGLGLAALGLTTLSLAALRIGEAASWWAVLSLAVVLFSLEVRLVQSREARSGLVVRRAGATS